MTYFPIDVMLVVTNTKSDALNSFGSIMLDILLWHLGWRDLWQKALHTWKMLDFFLQEAYVICL